MASALRSCRRLRDTGRLRVRDASAAPRACTRTAATVHQLGVNPWTAVAADFSAWMAARRHAQALVNHAHAGPVAAPATRRTRRARPAGPRELVPATITVRPAPRWSPATAGSKRPPASWFPGAPPSGHTPLTKSRRRAIDELTSSAGTGSVETRMRTKYSLNRSMSSLDTMSDTRKQPTSPCFHTHEAKPLSRTSAGRHRSICTRSRSGTVSPWAGSATVADHVAVGVLVVDGDAPLPLEVHGLGGDELEPLVAHEHAVQRDAGFLGEPRQRGGQDLAVPRAPHDRAGMLADHRAHVALHGIGGDDARQHGHDRQHQDHRGGRRRRASASARPVVASAAWPPRRS